MRAIKLASPLKVDGRLDDEVYAREKPFGGLIQVAPNLWRAAERERSDVWIMYDDQYMYVTCRCWDSAPPDEWIANELRRDTNGLRQNDHFGVMFDTYYDRRSGFAFYTNPLGARADYSVVDEGGSNTDWNPVWTSKTGRFEGGWIVEMAIPLKSLRYRAGHNQRVGRAAPALRAPQERVGLSHAGPAKPRRTAGAQPHLRRPARSSASIFPRRERISRSSRMAFRA